MILISSDHHSFESDGVEELSNTLNFSGSSGRISVGGDVIIDNEERHMFKEEVVKLMCKVKPKSEDKKKSILSLISGKKT